MNHSENFFNSNDQNIHTQNIERRWRSLKESIPVSTHGPNSSDHILEFKYKSIYHCDQPGLNFQTAFEHLQNNPFESELLDFD